MKMHRISQEGPEATGKILYVQFFLVLSLPICYTVFKAYISYVPAEKAVCIFLISFQKIYAFPNHHYEKQEIFRSPAKGGQTKFLYRILLFSIMEAVEHTVNECIREGILADFLSKNRAEAIVEELEEDISVIETMIQELKTEPQDPKN